MRSAAPAVSPARRLALVGLLIVGLSGCGSDFTPLAGTEAACAELLEQVPDRVANLDLDSRSEAEADWGGGKLRLRCGVALPDGVDDFSTCQTVNGVDWYVPTEQIEDAVADVTATTAWRDPRVEITVSASLRPQSPANAMIDLEDALRAATEVTSTCK